MSALYARHFGWWNWKVSARFRAASAGTIWLLIFGSSFLGPLLVPVAAIRFVASTGQFLLNRQLGRLQPLGPRPRTDWALLAVTLLASMAVAQVGQATGSSSHLLAIPVAIPFTAIQLRTCLRSERAHAALIARQPLPFPVRSGRVAA